MQRITGDVAADVISAVVGAQRSAAVAVSIAVCAERRPGACVGMVYRRSLMTSR